MSTGRTLSYRMCSAVCYCLQHQSNAFVARTSPYNGSGCDHSWKQQLYCAVLCNDLLSLVCSSHTLWCTLRVLVSLCRDWKYIAMKLRQLHFTAVKAATTASSDTALQSDDTCK
eukprot:11302-Heterococcus_DN1.PRE.4